MQRTGPVEVESEAGVALQRAVRPRAWFRHRLDTSIASESGRWTMMLLKLSTPMGRKKDGSERIQREWSGARPPAARTQWTCG
jgi:hypothetical protein